MSSELWQQAKEALAEAMTLDEQQRSSYLAELQAKSPELHSEVISLIASQEAAEQEGFLGDADDTMDIYRTETFDPAKTRQFTSLDDLDDPPIPATTPQDLVGPDYELGKKIGQGGMGVVYRAYHRSLRRTVALKIITAGGLRDEIDIARFHLEAEAAARLDHPGIIPVYDVGEHKGNHYYAMAYVEGPSLSSYVGKKAEKLSPRRAAELMEQVCHAVQFAHDRAVIHRDLKPANIMLENGEVPRLADFGLAKNMHEDEGLTMTGQVMGTPSYMAPEQASGKLDQISNRTDVYSLGATIYALLAGRPPFSGGTLLETIRQVVRTEPEPLTQIVSTIPRDLQTICEKCLAKRPEDRYASAADVAADLRRYLDGFPISARPLAPWARGLRWCQRNPLEATLLTVTAAALIIGTIVSVRFGIEANQQAAAAQKSLVQANENAQRLRSSIKESFIFASEDVLAQEPGMQAARAVLLETAQKYYAELVEQTPRDSASQGELAEAQFMLGKVQMAMGDDELANDALNSALTTQQKLVASSPSDAAALAALAKTHNQLARLAQRRWHKLTQLQALGKLPEDQAAKVDEQLDVWQQESAEVVRIRKLVVAEQSEDVESLRLLANAVMNQGIAVGTRGFTLKQLEEQNRARQIMLEAQAIRQRVLKDHSDESTLRRDLARGYYNLAHTEWRAAEQEIDDKFYYERLEQSVDDLTQAIATYQKLPAGERVLDNQQELARCYRQRGDAYYRLLKEGDDINPLVDDYMQAEELLERLTARNPNVYRYRVALSETQYNLSSFWFAERQDDEGIAQLNRCRATMLQALRIDPENRDAAEQIVLYTENIVNFLLEKIQLESPEKSQQIIIYDTSERLLQEALQELLALLEESSEYAGIEPTLELLRNKAAEVKRLRAKAETPVDVT